MKKKLTALILATVMLLSAAVGISAAVVNGKMNYLPGTEDTVTGMPVDADLGDLSVGSFAVSEDVPQRDGYEFLYWELDYAVYTSYTVRYMTWDAESSEYMDLTDPKCVVNIPAGTVVGEDALDIVGYVLESGETSNKELTLKPDAAENVITFYYELPPVELVSYTVRYIDVMSFTDICESKVVDGVPRGTHVIEYPLEIRDYIPINTIIEWDVEGNEEMIFLYFNNGGGRIG